MTSGVWLVPLTMPAGQRAALAAHGARVVESLWVTVAVWTVETTDGR